MDLKLTDQLRSSAWRRPGGVLGVKEQHRANGNGSNSASKLPTS